MKFLAKISTFTVIGHRHKKWTLDNEIAECRVQSSPATVKHTNMLVNLTVIAKHTNI